MVTRVTGKIRTSIKESANCKLADAEAADTRSVAHLLAVVRLT